MATQFLMLPPQTPTTRDWGARLAAALPELEVIVAEDTALAERAIATAESAFGTIPSALLRRAAGRLLLPRADRTPGADHQFP